MNWSKCLKLYHSVYNVWVSLFDDNLIYWNAFAINLLYSQELLIYQRFFVNSELLMKLTWQLLDCRTLTWSSYCICSQQNTEKRNLLYLRNIMAVKFLWGGYLWLVAAEAAADSRKKLKLIQEPGSEAKSFKHLNCGSVKRFWPPAGSESKFKSAAKSDKNVLHLKIWNHEFDQTSSANF